MQPHRFIIRHHFRDFDEFADIIRAWNLNIRQIESGSFEGDLFQFSTVDVQVAYGTFQPGTYQQGEPPHRLRTLCILSEPSSYLLWRHNLISANTVMAFPPGAELDAVSRGGRLGVFTLSFSDKLLANISQIEGFLDLDELLTGNDVIAVSPQMTTELRWFLNRICCELKKNPAKLETSSIRYELEFVLPCKILTALSDFREKLPKPNIRMRDLALRRVEDYLEEFPNNPHTVRDLCRVANASERTLQYAFHERFGMAPKTYLLALRLNGVHRELKNATTTSRTITDLATQWGFWHMSQFAADYKRLFGELPSETIGKKRLESRTL